MTRSILPNFALVVSFLTSSEIITTCKVHHPLLPHQKSHSDPWNQDERIRIFTTEGHTADCREHEVKSTRSFRLSRLNFDSKQHNLWFLIIRYNHKVGTCRKLRGESEMKGAAKGKYCIKKGPAKKKRPKNEWKRWRNFRSPVSDSSVCGFQLLADWKAASWRIRRCNQA